MNDKYLFVLFESFLNRSISRNERDKSSNIPQIEHFLSYKYFSLFKYFIVRARQ